MSKNILTLITALVIVWVMLPACNASKKLIIREWKVAEMEMESDFSGSPKHVEIFKNFKEKAQFVFNEDGTYFFDLITEKQSGKWEIVEKGKLLVTVSNKGIQTDNTIFELTENRLVIKNEKDPSPIKLFLLPKE